MVNPEPLVLCPAVRDGINSGLVKIQIVILYREVIKPASKK